MERTETFKSEIKFLSDNHTQDSFIVNYNHVMIYQEMQSGNVQTTYLTHDAIKELYLEVRKYEIQKAEQDSN